MRLPKRGSARMEKISICGRQPATRAIHREPAKRSGSLPLSRFSPHSHSQIPAAVNMFAAISGTWYRSGLAAR